MLPGKFETALQIILEQLIGLPEAWALTGSVGMALQGMPLQVHDIDLQTSPLGVIQIQQRLEKAEKIRRWLDSVKPLD